MKTVAIICARGGSKGLPRKNLKEIDGEPLVGRAVRHARAAQTIDEVVCSTDDPEIATVASAAGAQIPFIRPANLSGDLATTEETLKHALNAFEESKGETYDICVFLTPTDIFRDVSWIDEAVNRLRQDEALESVFVGCKTHKNFWEKDNKGRWKRLRPWMAEYSSRQIRRHVVREDTGLACASRSWLWRQGRRIGDVVDVIEVSDDFTSIDIHHEEDLLLARAAVEIRRGREHD